MRLARPAARRRRDDHLVPLINIVFLLLIFFMVVGRVTPAQPFAVDPPVSRYGEASPAEALVLLIDADGRIALDDQIVDPLHLGARVAARLADASAASGAADARVTIQADAGVRAQQLRETLDALRGAGVLRVRLLTARAG